MTTTFGDRWARAVAVSALQLAYDGVVCRLRDVRGLHHLAHLLAHPGTRVPSVQLSAAARGCDAAGTEQRLGPPAERARLTVTKAIKAALRKICAQHPPLGAHLTATIRRGYYCSYTPDPRYPIRWQV
jgi:hypothetical protein